MKTKKISALLCGAAMLVSLLTPAMAAETKEEIIDMGDGFYAVVTVEEARATRAGGSVYASKSAKLYNGSTVIGTVLLGASFDTSGATARATAATINGNGQNGWSYDHGTTSCSGNKASGTAYFKSGSTTKSLTLTITCNSDGTYY